MATDSSSQRRSYEELEDAVLAHYGISATHRMLDLKRPRIQSHALEYGEGVPTILMHGGDGEGWNFAPFMAAAKDDLHMYALDRPTYGRSGYVDYRKVPSLKDHAVEFMSSTFDELGLDSALIVASSFSGIFGLAFALAHPERVKGLVFPSYSAGVTKRASWGTSVRATFPRLAQGYADASKSIEGQKKLHEGLWGIAPGGLPDVWYEARVAGSQLPGAADMWVYLRNRAVGLTGLKPDACFESELPRLEMPVLQLWGEAELNNVKFTRDAISTIPDHRWVNMPNVGHFPHFQEPEKTIEYIREFLPTVAGAATRVGKPS